MRSLPVLYQDARLVAVNKPAGLLVHKTSIDRRETEYAMQVLRNQLGRWVYPLHRLDKATSGALLFALDRETAAIMTEAFTDGRISKSYLAVVRGFTEEAGWIDHPLAVLHDRMTDQRADRIKSSQPAVTGYERLATIELPYPAGRYATARFSLVRAHPRTGRTHQIRRHLKHIFHPVIGDTTYGDGKQNELFRQTLACRRLLLHGSEIGFFHPHSAERILIHAPLPPDFSPIVRDLRWDGDVGPLLAPRA